MAAGCRWVRALPADGGLEIHAVVVSPDGGRMVRQSDRGPAADAEAIGRGAGNALERLVRTGYWTKLERRDERHGSSKVSIVGAGPGDPGLVSVRGCAC